MKTLQTILIALFIFAPAVGQTPATLKKELQKKEAAASKDPAALIELASWAKENGLINDNRRLLQRVLELDPDNETARDLLGYVQFDGEWVTKSKADVLRRRALAEEMKAKGLVEVDGVWVAKGEVTDAKKGLFRHDGQVVSKSEKLALLEGRVRHPRTGEFITADELAKAEDGFFPIDGGRWVSEAEADTHHASTQRPWVVRSAYCTLVSQLPLETIEELAPNADSGIESVQALFGSIAPLPAHRPVILIATDSDQYRQFGEGFGAEGSAYGVFLAEDDQEYPGIGRVRPTVTHNSKDWSPYWVRHAAALAYARGIAADLGASLPLWFQRGVGGMAGRHFNKGVASWFGKRHLEKGGVKDLASWFANFQISGDLEPSVLDYNVFQAGLVLAFAMYGKERETTDALLAVTEAFAKDAKAVEKAIRDLQSVLVSKQDAVREYLRQLTQG